MNTLQSLTVIATAAALLAMAGPAAADIKERIEQAEQRDASGRLIVEAASIVVVQCTNGLTQYGGVVENGALVYVYSYKNRPGHRAIYPPNWGSPVGGRDFATQGEALKAGCGSRQL